MRANAFSRRWTIFTRTPEPFTLSRISLSMTPRTTILTVLRAALDGVDPGTALLRSLSLSGNALLVSCSGQQRSYPLADYDRILVVGCGKGGVPMGAAVEGVLGERITAGVITVKYGHCPGPPLQTITVVEAAHPTPDEAGRQGCLMATQLLHEAGPRDLVLALISGGGSALWPAPAPGLTLQDKQSVTGRLLESGATINEINCVRKHLSAIKGGLGARLAFPAPVVALAISDVIGDDPAVIASGPFAPDTTRFDDARGVITRYGLHADIPEAVAQHLLRGIRGEIPETPLPADPCFAGVQQVLCATNAHALQGAAACARTLGYEPVIVQEPTCGEAATAARAFVHRALALHATRKRFCLIAGGETTVTLGREYGTGGRNQEFALAAALELYALQGNAPGVTVASLGTDGTDGPTDAAGGIVNGTTVTAGYERGFDAQTALRTHNAYPFLAAVGGLVTTGPTATNVMDIQLALC